MWKTLLEILPVCCLSLASIGYALCVPLWVVLSMVSVRAAIEKPSAALVIQSVLLALLPPAAVVAVYSKNPEHRGLLATITLSFGGPFWLYYAFFILSETVKQPSAELIALEIVLVGLPVVALTYHLYFATDPFCDSLCCCLPGRRCRDRRWQVEGIGGSSHAPEPQNAAVTLEDMLWQRRGWLIMLRARGQNARALSCNLQGLHGLDASDEPPGKRLSSVWLLTTSRRGEGGMIGHRRPQTKKISTMDTVARVTSIGEEEVFREIVRFL